MARHGGERRFAGTRARLAAILAIGSLALAACGGAPAAGNDAATAAARLKTGMENQAAAVKQATGSTVVMTGAFRFDPAELRVPVGTTVTWRNDSGAPHTATFDPARAKVAPPSGAQPFDSGSLSQGQTFSHTFDAAGTFEYVCTFHAAAGMVGTVVVE